MSFPRSPVLKRPRVSSPTGSPLPELQQAILQTIAYADVFEYPLSAAEVHRYLVGVPASPEMVRAQLTHLSQQALLLSHEGYYTLAAREGNLAARQRRAAVAATLWPQALFYGRQVAALPFVRMVAVTGALAADNVDPDADIDFLIVTEPGRLWLCRLLVILLVRAAAQRGAVLCPNYFLSERALLLEEQSLFAARELVQMVPIAGMSTYGAMRRLNAWTDAHLPNATGAPPKTLPETPRMEPLKHAAEAVLRTAPGAWLDQWEMQRKVRKFERQYAYHTEANFSPDWCKGHFDAHGQRIMDAYQARVATLDIG